MLIPKSKFKYYGVHISPCSIKDDKPTPLEASMAMHVRTEKINYEFSEDGDSGRPMPVITLSSKDASFDRTGKERQYHN